MNLMFTSICNFGFVFDILWKDVVTLLCSGKTVDLPDDVVNALAFFEDFLHYSKLSRKVNACLHFLREELKKL